MKGEFVATALVALAGSVNAAFHGHGHQHLLVKRSNTTGEVCVPGCTTIWSAITGEATLVPIPLLTTTATVANTTTVTIVKLATRTAPPPPPATSEVTVVPVPVPTPQPHVLPTPGTYTLTATTITVSQTTTVCAAASTKLPSGTHTVGGLTTVVQTATTLTCPVAVVSTSGTVTTSTIVQTEYVCPSAGTYTIAPVTTTVTQETVVVYPVPTSYNPGTYVAPQKVVTVTETDFVYYCPFTSAGLSSRLPTTTAAPAPQNTTLAAPPPPPPASTEEETTATAESRSAQSTAESRSAQSTAAESSGAQSAASQSTTAQATSTTHVAMVQPSYGPHSDKSTSVGLTSNNDHFGITYTPYEPSNGQCKSSSKVERDMEELKGAGFTTVRVYSTDCHTLDNVGSACQKHGLNMIVGIFVKGGGCSYNSPDIKEQIDELASWDKWDLVKLVVVGNEAIMNGYCSPTELGSLVTTVKSKCSKYRGPYTISETLNIWQRPDVASAICDVVDVTGANIHPYFNAEVTPETAGDFVAGQLDLLGNICKGHEAINLECGWPTRGSCNGKACPGTTEQAAAIRSIRQKTGSKTVFFSYEDDLWKEAGSCGCEKSWGAAAAFKISLGVSL